MPADPQTVVMLDPDGVQRDIPADTVGQAIARGFRVESDRERLARLVTEQRTEEVSGFGNTLAAGIQSGANALSLGGYGALSGAAGGGDLYNQLQEAHPDAALAGTVVGTVAPAILTAGGSLAARGAIGGAEGLAGAGARLLEATPAAFTSRLGSKIAGLGEGAGFLGRTAAATGGAALEGAAQGAGSYISDVALGNKELSADGFVGAMGQGALWGGAAGGALSIGASGLTAARRLFPKQEMTRAAVEAAKVEAVQAVKAAADDSQVLVDSARTKLRDRRAVLSQDPAIRAQLDEIAISKAREIADAEVSAARSKAAEAGSKAEAAAFRAEKAKAPRRTRKALQDETPGAVEPPTGTPEAPVVPVAAADVPADAATLLERQLAATKGGIDAGETLAQLNAKRTLAKPTAVEDAVNAHLAKVDPEAAKLVRGIEDVEESQLAVKSWLDKYGKGSQVDRFERSAKARETADSWRSKKAGWVSSVPEGEGNQALARGRQWTWRGTDDARAAAEDAFYAKQGGREALEGQTRRVFPGDEALAPRIAPAAERSLDDRLSEALGKKTDDITGDVGDTAAAVGRMEDAHARLADELGTSAPMSSQARAAQFRDAERASEQAGAESVARTTGDAERAAATVSLSGELPAAAKAGGKGAVDGALKVGDVLEALSLMGVGVPDVGRIPVVGPVLKAVLQARLLGKAFGRFGGKLPETAETVIASKAAAVKQRVYTAVDQMLGGAAKGAGKAAAVSGGPAAVLGHVLFDDRQPGEAAPKASKDLGEVYAMRLDELARSQAPGAIHEAVRQRVRASDPAIVDAIAAGQERKLKYLYDKAPKPDHPDGLLAPKVPWMPSGSEIRTFSRLVAAADDPAGVLERAAKGGVVLSDEIEAVKTIYPTLYEDARARLVTKAIEMGSEVPYARRVQLSLLFDLPLDSTMRPEYVHFMQSSYQPPPPAPQTQAPAITPTIAADVNLATRTDPFARG